MVFRITYLDYLREEKAMPLSFFDRFQNDCQISGKFFKAAERALKIGLE
jgi:hypothetical protein